MIQDLESDSRLIASSLLHAIYTGRAHPEIVERGYCLQCWPNSENTKSEIALGIRSNGSYSWIGIHRNSNIGSMQSQKYSELQSSYQNYWIAICNGRRLLLEAFPHLQRITEWYHWLLGDLPLPAAVE